MQEKMFGTDGIRGLANKTPITIHTAAKLGSAIAMHAAGKNSPHRRILVGKDTRISSSMLEAAITAGICSRGSNTILAGTMPTPGIAFLTVNMRCDAGVVISASHNPFEDNGIKFFSANGFKLSDDDEAAVEHIFLHHDFEADNPTGNSIGRPIPMDDALGRYVVFVKNTLPRGFDLEGIRVVLDSANGAGHEAAPAVFEELGAAVFSLAATPDGANINRNCGSLYPKLMCEEVGSRGADVGIALDGDADRVIFADENGEEVDGDQIMGLIAWDMIKRNQLKKNTLVATVMSNAGLEASMKEMGGSLVRTPVGDRYVVERMRRDGYNFGGEQSGHLIFLDHNTTGDGIMAALQVMRVVRDTGKPLSILKNKVRKFPQVLKNIEVKSRRNLEAIPEVQGAILEAEKTLGKSGRLLARYSGTELLCRIMAEGEDEDLVNKAVDMVADAVSRNL